MNRTCNKGPGSRFYATRFVFFLQAPALAIAALTAQAEIQAPGYTAEQAARGQTSYNSHCASCHGENLNDGRFAPSLRGGVFLQNWGSRTLDKLFVRTATSMPTAAPNSLGDEAYTAILAYLLKRNGVSAGSEELPADPIKLAELIMPASDDYPSGGLSVGVSLPDTDRIAVNPLDNLNPVTDAMLEDVPPSDWLTWRRGNHALGFSPLTEINRNTVGRLKVAWSWSLPAGPSTTIPLVHDGVIFVHGYGDVVQAIDAASGSLLWQYRRWIPASVPTFNYRKRSIALYDKFLYLPASDGHMVALDARTGEVGWQTQIVDIEKGQRITGGPLLARGKVMIGTSGEMKGGNIIVGLDALTGKEEWRFNTIPKPGEPGGDSWNGMRWEARSGGSVWTVGSYDPDSGLAYFGPAPTYDTGPLAKPVNRPGITNDALYTNATIALEPDTGRLAWHFQHFPNDQWDQDWSFERHILKIQVGDENKTVVATGGKLGIYDVLEAKSGKYIASVDLGVQNIVTGIDARTGAKQVNPTLQPSRERTVTVCPNNAGGKNWMPSAYSPATQLLFVPLMEICMDMIPVPADETGFLSTGVRVTSRPFPANDGNYGRLQAINLETMKIAWTRRQRAPFTSGTLATAGGLVFVGDVDRYLFALGENDGEILWKMRLNDVLSSSPVTYTTNGKQYLAVNVGHGVVAVDRKSVVPEVTLPMKPAPTLWVFELAEK